MDKSTEQIENGLIELYKSVIKENVAITTELSKMYQEMAHDYGNLMKAVSSYVQLDNPDTRLRLMLIEHGVINNVQT